MNRIVIFHRQLAQEMGFVIPSIRLRDSSNLNTNQYVIKIKGEEVPRRKYLWSITSSLLNRLTPQQ